MNLLMGGFTSACSSDHLCLWECRCGAVADLPGVLHEEAVDQHNARKRLHGRLHLPLLPGEFLVSAGL